MDNSLYQYLRQLHLFIELQEKKVKALEQKTAQLQQEIALLKERPPVQVGTIEYKFDQLKVETLEGTLNIGMNPGELEGMTDFTVENKHYQPAPSPKNGKKITPREAEIEKEILRFLDNDLPSIFAEAREKHHVRADDSLFPFIKEDIIRQLPQRISAHLGTAPGGGTLNEEALKEIAEKIKLEIGNGVSLFLQQLQRKEEEETK